MSLFLNILHYSIYFLSFIALLSLIIRGSKAKLEAMYIGLFLLIQSVYNGCPITTIQNYYWLQEGFNPVENTFIFSSLLPQNLLILRIIFFFIGLIYLTNLKNLFNILKVVIK